MGAKPIPLTPAPLSVEQAEVMAQRQIKKHHVAIMLLHWFNAIVWMFELITGAALMTSPRFRFAPHWYLDIVQGVFGSRANILAFHIALGVTWIVVFLVYGTFGFRTYLDKEVLHREIGLEWDDIEWLRIRLLKILNLSRESLPPQGVYNAGQKLFALLVYAMIPVVMLTGLTMGFHLLGPEAIRWAITLHFLAVGLVVSGLMIHVYMGAVFPEEKPAFFSMITGTVNELYAYRHHFKWWREVKMEEAEWVHKLESPGVMSPPGPPAAAGNPSLVEGPPQRLVTRTLWRVFRQPEYWPPYIAGVGLGLTLLATFVLMGEGLGASGGFTRYLVAALASVAPGYAQNSAYWSAYLSPGQSALMSFLVIELVGVLIGGFVSGWLAGRLRLTVDKGPRTSTRTRYAWALLGGILTGIGARLARGCTSGLALSGGAVLSVGAFIFMLSVFAAGFIGAYFMRRYWL